MMKLSKLLVAPMLASALILGSCTNGVIDPVKVADGCKATCGFVPFIESITAFMSANPVYMSLDALVQVLCASFKSAQQAGVLQSQGKLTGELASGSVVSFDVVVNGKIVKITGTVR